MSSDQGHSVTRWLSDLKAGDRDEAARNLWDRYFDRIARLAHGQLRSGPRGVADGEDVALSVFDNLFADAPAGRFPKLDDRTDLWKLLTTIVLRKSSNRRRSEGRQKRGGGRVVVGGDLAEDGDPLAQVAGAEPSPADALVLIEEVRRRLADLPDESLRVVALLRMEGHSNDEIARRLDCSPRSVDRKLDLIRKAWGGEADP